MVTECNSCRARYRMKESMMNGFKGAEMRCRKCGGTFVVVPPGTVSGEPESADRGIRTGGPPDSHSPNEMDGPAGGREDSPPGDAGERLQPAETATLPRATPVEETKSAPPVPDNVYCLTRFREALPKRLPTGGYDISETIRPEPSYSPPERMPAAPPTLPAPREEKGTPFPPEGYPVVPPRESRIPELSSSDGSHSQSGYSPSVYPRLTDIAVVYLLLLFLGGCGYLLVHFLSRMVNGEIG
jgi:predicted Zn finger-like uncharacterized protein